MLERMDRKAADEVITPETVQRQQQPRPVGDDQQQPASSPQSDKRGNVFQRLLRALRKRFARQQQQTTTSDQQRQRQLSTEKRQRTL